jgi:hypothetical protein
MGTTRRRIFVGFMGAVEGISLRTAAMRWRKAFALPMGSV